jgi:hypothetical protein
MCDTVNDHNMTLHLIAPSCCSWMVSRRVRDLALLSREGVLDVPSLAYGMYMRDRLRAHAVLEVGGCLQPSVGRVVCLEGKHYTASRCAPDLTPHTRSFANRHGP